MVFQARASSTLADGQAELALSYLGARLEFSPIGVYARRYFAEVGAGVEFARLEAAVSLQTDVRVLDFPLLLRAGGILLDTLILEAQGELVFPTSEAAFYYESSGQRRLAYEIPDVGWALRVGVAVRFP